ASTQVEASSPDDDLLAKFDMKDLMSALEQEMEEESAPAFMPEINDAVLMEPLALIRNDGVMLPAANTDFPVTRTTPAARTAHPRTSSDNKSFTWILLAALVVMVVIGAWLWRVRRLSDASGRQPVRSIVSSPGSTPAKSTGTASSVANPTVPSEAELTSATRPSEKVAAGKRSQTLSPKKGSAVLPAALSAASGADFTPAPSLAGLSTATNAPLLPSVGQPASPVFQPSKVSSGLRGG